MLLGSLGAVLSYLLRWEAVSSQQGPGLSQIRGLSRDWDDSFRVSDSDTETEVETEVSLSIIGWC